MMTNKRNAGKTVGDIRRATRRHYSAEKKFALYRKGFEVKIVLPNYADEDALEYLKPQTHLLKGLPGSEISAFANKNKVNLMVMGTLSCTGISGIFMGNTAETILNQLNCSLLAIKPPGFISPITLED